MKSARRSSRSSFLSVSKFILFLAFLYPVTRIFHERHLFICKALRGAVVRRVPQAPDNAANGRMHFARRVKNFHEISGLSLSAPDINPPLKGYFQSSSGEKCRYQTVCRQAAYFSSSEQRICIHTFDDSGAMPNDDSSKRMIANVVARFYTSGVFQSDTKFKTDPVDWKPAAGFQQKGFCITASNYPLPAIWIDFVLSLKKQSIIKVIHGKGLNF